METDDLTREQLEKIQERIGDAHRYVRALLDRMKKEHFPQDDRLQRMTVELGEAMHSFSMALHYLLCDKRSRQGRSVGRHPFVRHAYRVNVAHDGKCAMPKLDDMEWIEADSPLEAAFVLAKRGELGEEGDAIVRVVISGKNGRAEDVVVIKLERAAISDFRERVKPH